MISRSLIALALLCGCGVAGAQTKSADNETVGDEHALIGVKRIFVAAALRRLDDDANRLVVLHQGFQVRGVAEASRAVPVSGHSLTADSIHHASPVRASGTST